MKKKGSSYIYVALCLLLCMLPFVGMAVYGTDATTENRTLATLPPAVRDGKLNTDYFEELGAYFEDHFSFREELVTVDALIQSKVFSVSNVDTVIAGTDGWLYYTDTLDDYLGTNTMNPRQVFQVANNLSLLQRYVTEHGAKFVFTVAPNKNSLYGEHMPYYAGKRVGEEKNISLLEPQLARAGISYVDLFSVFERFDETLYLKRDSHWNGKGAVLAYNTIFDALTAEHERYETVDVVREKSEVGDLNRMLYPLAAKPEWNYDYQTGESWNYTGEAQDVEAAWIQTACGGGDGSLLMFRDSFGNTLLPLMAEQFEQAAFSKGVPYLIGRYMEECAPDVVIAEKVERNLDEYLTAPPVMEGPVVNESEDTGASESTGAGTAVTGTAVKNRLTEVETGIVLNVGEAGLNGADIADSEAGTDRADAADGKTDTDTAGCRFGLRLETAMEDMDYVALTGEPDAARLGENAQIFVRIHGKNGGKDTIYEAFTVSTEQSDYGFLLYLKKETLEGLATDGNITIDILSGEPGSDTVSEVLTGA